VDSTLKLPAKGDVLAGKYVIDRVLAEGGMGVVLAAHHQRLGQQVAIKVLHPHLRAMPDVTRRFEQEARTAARLTSANVARVVDVDSLPDGSPFMVMEFLRGHDLGTELDQRRKLPIDEAVVYVLQASAAMDEAHGLGIIHRDLKPSNLFLAEEGGGRTVKVLDFGISKVTEDVNQRMTATQSVLGTPHYMSPEQVRSSKSVDARSDVWALGIILYELVSGTMPFQGETATSIAAAIAADDAVPLLLRDPSVPSELAAAVMRALEKKPADRYADVRAFARAIAPFSGEPAPAWVDGGRRSSTSVIITSPATGEQAAVVRADDATMLSDAEHPVAVGGSQATRGNWAQGTGDHAPIRRMPSRLSLALFAAATTVAGAALFIALRGNSSSETASPVVASASTDAALPHAATPATITTPSATAPKPEPTVTAAATVEPPKIWAPSKPTAPRPVSTPAAPTVSPVAAPTPPPQPVAPRTPPTHL